VLRTAELCVVEQALSLLLAIAGKALDKRQLSQVEACGGTKLYVAHLSGSTHITTFLRSQLEHISNTYTSMLIALMAA